MLPRLTIINYTGGTHVNIQAEIAQIIHAQLDNQLTVEDIHQLLEAPKQEEHGDVAFPTFQLAKIFRQNPAEIAKNLAEKLDNDLIEKVEVVGPYINFFLNRSKVSQAVIQDVQSRGKDYGSLELGSGNVPIDMSSPNIAKPMSMGHLRSTVIGNAIGNILAKVGYTPIRINHLGDWGTQFGKLIYAYQQWGDEQAIENEPIAELLRIYVKFHDEAEKDPALDDQGRLWFHKLEQGDETAWQLWERFRNVSLKEFNKIYDRLHIEFDSTKGEAFYNDKMQPILDELEDKQLTVLDEGAYIVDLEAYDLNPALIKKKDGATLYITRDLAAANYRHETYDFAQSLYVVGHEQANHFAQLKAVLAEMGREWQENMHHIQFGLITKDGQKLSTRKGKVILLEDVLDEAAAKALEQIEAKNPNLANKEDVAEQVGVGAVVFHDLQNDRKNSFDFTIDEVVQFEGETGPYVQYTRVRALSILENAGYERQPHTNLVGLDDDYSWRVVKLIEEFSQAIARAYRNYEPSIITKYILSLAQAFNRFYANVHVMEAGENKESLLALVDATQEVIHIGLDLLGVPSPEEM